MKMNGERRESVSWMRVVSYYQATVLSYPSENGDILCPWSCSCLREGAEEVWGEEGKESSEKIGTGRLFYSGDDCGTALLLTVMKHDSLLPSD